MKCGFYELDITPAIGSIIPGDFGARFADDILDKLYVRAVVFDNGETSLAIAVIDACGDINHINPFDISTYCDRYEAYRRVGTTIAKKAADAIENAGLMDDSDLKTISSSVEVKFRKPSKERLLWAKERFESLGDSLIESTPKSEDYMDTFFALQTFLIQADKRTKRTLELQVFKIGKCHIFATPCQMFVKFGKKVKKACGEYCFVSAFANDYAGYVPTSECMKEGVYEATLAPTSALEAAAGDIVTDELIEMYNKLNG